MLFLFAVCVCDWSPSYRCAATSFSFWFCCLNQGDSDSQNKQRCFFKLEPKKRKKLLRGEILNPLPSQKQTLPAKIIPSPAKYKVLNLRNQGEPESLFSSLSPTSFSLFSFFFFSSLLPGKIAGVLTGSFSIFVSVSNSLCH